MNGMTFCISTYNNNNYLQLAIKSVRVNSHFKDAPFVIYAENCDDGGEPECTAGDINADGIINVLDIVSTVNFVMNVATPTDDEACAADLNSDGIINVVDIVQLVNIILN